MAKRKLLVDLNVGPSIRPTGVSWIRFRVVQKFSDGTSLTLPYGEPIQLVDGKASVDLEVGKIWEALAGINGGAYYTPLLTFEMPAGSGDVNYADLVPADPPPDDPAWGPTAVEARQARDEAVAAAGVATGDAATASIGATTATTKAAAASTSAIAAASSATQTGGDRTAVAADRILAQSARDQALYAAGLVPGSAGILFYTGVAWYEAGAAAPDTYAAVNASGSDAGALAGNTGYARQSAGVPMNPQVQSRMRRCVLANDGAAIVYYLDCDDSTKIAGKWKANTQSGWVRVHEGVFDPVHPMPGQTGTGNAALRAGVPAHDPAVSYAVGDRVISAGSVWESLNGGNIGVAPAAGTTAADLSGVAGQVMVEIPRFYSLVSYDATVKRHSWEVVFDQSEVKPFPLLADSPALPGSKMVNGRVFPVHPAFAKAGVQRRSRFIAAFGTSCTDVGNNGSGTLRSIRDGVITNTTNVALSSFTAKARNRNVGVNDPSGDANNVWQVADNWLYNALQIAYLTEYRTLYSQSTLGGGNQSGGDYNKIAGRSCPSGNASGSFNAAGVLQTPSAGADFDGMIYRGIEDVYSSAYRWTAGGVIKNAPGGKLLYYSNTPAAFVDNADGPTYELVASGIAVPATQNWYYASALAPGSFMASATDGSSSSFTTDGNYLLESTDNSFRILGWGAYASSGALGGFFAVAASSTAAIAGTIGGAALAR